MNTDLPYGINAHAPGEADIAQLIALQAPWVRLDFNWPDMEPTREGYDYRYWDGVVFKLHDLGFHLYPTLSYTPAWANGGRDRGAPPTNPEDWYNFVANVAAHYRDVIHWWSLWNEPNDQGIGVSQYVNLILRPGHDALKAVNPDNHVCGPELATVQDWQWWLANMLWRGRQYLDYLSLHAYAGNGHDVITRVNRIVSFGLPILLTEVGWNSDTIGEAAQADHLQQLLESFPGSRVKRLFVYDLSSQGWGIAGKPAFNIYQRVT